MATTFPGGITSNIVGSTYTTQSPQDQAAAYNLQKQMKEDKEREWARAAAANANLGQPLRDPQAEADAKMKSAFEKFYAPMAQSQWDQQQGQVSGLIPGRVSGTPGPGYQAYKKNALTSGVPGQVGIAAGQQPYEYRKDTNLPDYQQNLQAAYDMWKAGQMMGAEDWKVYGYFGKGGGSGKEGGGTYSGPSGGMERYSKD